MRYQLTVLRYLPLVAGACRVRQTLRTSLMLGLLSVVGVSDLEAAHATTRLPPVETLPARPMQNLVTSAAAYGEVLSSPQCFNVINKAEQTIVGSIRTNRFRGPDGKNVHHRSNFRLRPEERTEFCTTGPLYPGRTVELTLRTLVPLFSCKTGISGDILLHSGKTPQGQTRLWADCLPPMADLGPSDGPPVAPLSFPAH